MDSPERGALMLVRIVAAALIGWAVVNLGLYWAKCSLSKPPVPFELVPGALNLLPAIAGIALFIRAKAVAAWLSDKLDL